MRRLLPYVVISCFAFPTLASDRVEGEIVVVEMEGGGTLDLPRWLLPPKRGEGDVIVARAAGGEGGWRVEMEVDAEETGRRRAAMKERVERLAARDPGGDITL